MINRSQGKIAKLVALAALFALVAVGGCNRAARNESAQKNVSQFEKDLASVQRNHYAQTYVISRPDGGQLNADDIAYLKANMPIETTMRILTDEDRRVIIGTNFEFKPEHFDALNRRFKLEDYTGK
ncbi:MAG TPA: hypothetical protein VJT82_06120 [Pyrinomonadaceae bacterium]|nr:hypothetical protein [Pyrinomonadaceae bacterium]